MDSSSFFSPMPSSEDETIPDDEVLREGSTDTIVLMAVDDEDSREDEFQSRDNPYYRPAYGTTDMSAGAEVDGVGVPEEIPESEPDPIPIVDAAAELDSELTWMLVEEPEQYPATAELALQHLVEEQPAAVEFVEEHPVPMELVEEQPLPQELAVVEPNSGQADLNYGPEPGQVDETGEPGQVDETGEQRYDRNLIEAYSRAIHLGYDADLDAIAVQFTNCPVMESSDVPWIFQTIGRKIQELFASDTWHQHGLLLDVAGLQVAPEAEAVWEMMLDGFVTQLCPEVAPRIALAIQYDSSGQYDATPEGEKMPELQRASSVTGQPRPLMVARSFEAALLLLQLMRREN
jgi:hypothetical protein